MKNLIKKCKNYFLSNILPFLAFFFIRGIISTCRFEFRGLDPYLKFASEKGAILAIWHNRILLLPYFGKYTSQVNYSAVISNSRDGDPISRVISSFPNAEAIRVAHDARSQALKAIIKKLKTGKVVVITPDGPRGPLYKVKPGISFAAAVSSSKIFPATWTCSRYWQLGTWDKMMLPKPFSQIVFSIGDTVEVSRKDSRDMEKVSGTLQNILHSLAKENTP
jgi:lysophospholipid acyltransferase (LPLAT)-like uncharacterized protein